MTTLLPIAILVALGAPPPVQLPSTWSAVGEKAGVQLGVAIASAGDVDNDGYDDVLVGSVEFVFAGDRRGRVYLYEGSAQGLNASPAKYWTGTQPGANFANSVAGAGDVNNDGYDDVLFAASRFEQNFDDEGRVWLHLGGPDGVEETPACWWDGDQPDAHFGETVAGIGDVNDDGYDDVAIAAPFYDGLFANAGRVSVFHGGPGGLSVAPDWIRDGDHANANFGSDIASAGDVNGDGHNDLLVGSDTYGPQTTEGAAYVFHGSALGLWNTPRWVGYGLQDGSGFGHSVDGAFDIDADGYDDIIVGAWAYDRVDFDEGRVWMYRGSASGVCTAAKSILQVDDSPPPRFGWSVAGVGDLDGDGHSDVAVGAIGYDESNDDEGGVFVYRGNPGGLASNAAWSAVGGEGDAFLGQAVAGAGDVDGDGAADLLVAAPGMDANGRDAGRVQLYYGDASVTATPAVGPALAMRVPAVVRRGDALTLTIPHVGPFTVEVFDLRGRRIRTFRGDYGAGSHALIWDARDDLGGSMASGRYVLRLRWRDRVRTGKLTYLR